MEQTLSCVINPLNVMKVVQPVRLKDAYPSESLPHNILGISWVLQVLTHHWQSVICKYFKCFIYPF